MAAAAVAFVGVISTVDIVVDHELFVNFNRFKSTNRSFFHINSFTT